MKFEELKRSLGNSIDCNYMLVGNDTYLLDYAYNLIFGAAEISERELNENRVDADIDPKQLKNLLLSMPIFSPKRIVKIDGVLKESTQKELLEYFKGKNPYCVVVINAHDRLSDYKTISEYFTVVDCNKLSSEIISKFIIRDLNNYGKKITPKALATLEEYSLYDMSKITIELKKLVSFVDSREQIDVDDVENIVTKSEEYSVFELTDALAKGDAKRAYSVLESFRTKQNKTLIYLIYNHFRRMFYIKVSKKNISEYASLLGVKEFAVKKANEQASKFRAVDLKNILQVVSKLDSDLKNSIISYDNALDYVVLYILNIVGQK